MFKASQVVGLLTAIASVAAPVVATAQTAGSPTQGAPSGAQQGGMQPQQLPQQQQPPQQGGMQRQGSTASRAVPINGNFRFPLAGGCTYTADVQGQARPVRVGQSAAEPMFAPDVNIDAAVACPNLPTIRVRETLAGAARPMTLAQIEAAIELRAAMVTVSSGAHCAYVPNFRLTQQALEGVGAALLCPLPGSARGGGPEAQDQGQQGGAAQGADPSGAQQGAGQPTGQQEGTQAPDQQGGSPPTGQQEGSQTGGQQ